MSLPTGSIENIDLDFIPARALNASTRDRLGRVLDFEQPLFSKDKLHRDYRGLAQQMGYEYNDIKHFKSTGSPTKSALELWTGNDHATIGMLIVFLEKIQRYHLIQDLQQEFENDAKKYLHRNALNRGQKKTDEVSSEKLLKNNGKDSHILTRQDVVAKKKTFYDAYVIYADEDYDRFVTKLSSYLEESGFKLCIRSRDLLAGHDEHETSLKLIQERCRRVLVVLSPFFINYPACKVQAAFAVRVGLDEQYRKPIPILLEPCEIPYFLKGISMIDLTKPIGNHWVWNKLMISLQDSAASEFVHQERKPHQLPLLEIESGETIGNSNAVAVDPVITFPSTSTLYSNNDSAQNLFSSHREAECDPTSTVLHKNVTPPEQKKKFSDIFSNFTKFLSKSSKKNGTSPNTSSEILITSSSTTSGFCSDDGNTSELIHTKKRTSTPNL